MCYNPFQLRDKTILVTGASSGIGQQCAIDCSRMGARVVLVARDEERLEGTLSLLEGSGHCYYKFDLNCLEEIEKLIEKIKKDVGRLNGFVHAAGIEKTLPMKWLKVSDYEGLLRVNFLSSFEIIKCLARLGVLNKESHIVLIASILSVIGRKGLAAYAASKGAMVAAIRAMALELASKKICVNCVSPGTILTPMMQKYLLSLDEEEYKKRLEGFPLGMGETVDVSNMCIYLLSDASRWITGQNFIVDGGYTIK